MRKRIIWFCNTEYVAEHPESLVWLRDEIGLTTIMPESPICHTSGFAATPEVAARGPFEDWRSRAGRWPKADDGIYPPVAGVVGGFDDAPLRRVLEAAEPAGIEVWGHIGLWSYGGDVYPEWAMRDIDGSELDPRYGRWGIGLCPSKEAVNAWVEEGLLDVIDRYCLDGFCVDHARYPQPANVHALAACGCADCREAAEANGFDVDALIGAVRDARGVLEGLDEVRVKRAEASGGSGEVILDALGMDGGSLMQWFRCRAALLAGPMAHFRAAVQVAQPELVFGSDIFPPSVALLGGHDVRRWEEATDFITGGTSAGGVVGWATGAVYAASSWVRALRALNPELDEARLCRVARLFFALDDVPWPDSADALEESEAIEVYYRRELGRLKLLSRGGIPLYPPIAGGGDPVRVRALANAVAESGCHGAMVTLDPSNRESIQALGEELGRVRA
tara:strand:+ start:1165 stop:2511 length:1347 start_codon:yes stop_codon:yes gene_type:complete